MDSTTRVKTHTNMTAVVGSVMNHQEFERQWKMRMKLLALSDDKEDKKTYAAMELVSPFEFYYQTATN